MRGPGFNLKYHKISKGRKERLSLPFVRSLRRMHLPLIASCGCVSENTPLPALAGLLPAPECRSLISEASKPFGGYQILRESVLHPNNYLPRFLIINSFNLFTLNQFYLINLLFSGKLPTFQIFQRRISLSGLANAHPEEVPTRQGPSSTSLPLAPSSYRRVPGPVGCDFIFCSSHHLSLIANIS